MSFGERMLRSFFLIIFSSLVMSAAAWAANHFLEPALPGGVLVRKHVDVYLSLRLAIAIATGSATLLIAARALRIEEFDEAASRVLRRFSTRGDRS